MVVHFEFSRLKFRISNMKIGIVNVGVLAAEAIRRVIVRSGKHDVAWIARDGAEAVARCHRDRPDLVLMDLFMPRLDGVLRLF